MGFVRTIGIVLIAVSVTPLAIGLLSQVCVPNLPEPPATTAPMSCSWPSVEALVFFGLPGLLLLAAGIALVLRNRKEGPMRTLWWGPDARAKIR